MKIAIVIVNYKTPDLVIECLKSLQRDGSKVHTLKIHVGDADSGDGSVESINKFIDESQIENAECFAIGANKGFAYGNNFIVENKVMTGDKPDYVYFLNPDTYVLPGAIDALVAALEDDIKVAIAGSRLENPDGSERAYGFNFPSPWREFFNGAKIPYMDKLAPFTQIHRANINETTEVDWVTGASFMARYSVLSDVGLMDDGYFLYFEEVDWMRRIRKAGYDILHVANARVVHHGGQATGMNSPRENSPLPEYWFQSRAKYFYDNFGVLGLYMANILYLIGDGVYRVHRAIRARPIETPPNLWRGLFAYGFSPANIRG